ncbi:hypothetical protein MKX01_023947 [Papaver californicum]|nr:hypothetical protein MKX01_023947 [Papaver californicum]
MPPSPSWRFSPNGMNHKRGRSLDGGLFPREKDDDLALFNDMEMKEEDNILLEPNDDLDESFSTKLRNFSTSKPGITIPVRGASIDLLNSEGDKHDYDWLLTPPGSPVFTSLDNEASLETFSRVGRPLSQPLSTSRSSRTEKGYRNTRSSASPHRSSPSPISQARGRPSSASGAASRASSTPTSRAKTRSPSYPRNKPSTPPLGSSNPTFQKTSLRLNGTSQAKTSRGDSLSPKVRAWQFDIPTPPNLRTSIADRPASYVRGSSPASRNGRGLSPASRSGRGLSPASRSDRGSSSTPRSERGSSPASIKECGTPPALRNGINASPRSWRQSVSPTASTSASSLYSHDGDQFSSHGKGSVASSGDADVDSLQSASLSISSRSTIRKIGIYPHSKTPTFAKSTFSRTPSVSSAPKKSSYSALRRTDKKSSQAMFRPLLLSAPNTTFYVEKENSPYQYHHTNTKNFSVVTSINASSENVDVVTFCSDGVDLYRGDHTKYEKEINTDAQVESKVIGMNENVELNIHNHKMNLALGTKIEGMTGEVSPCETENLRCQNDVAISASTSSSLNIEDFDCHTNETSCSKCGRKFYVVVQKEDNNGMCKDCNETDVCMPLATKMIHEVEVPELKKLNTEIEPLIVTGEINLKQGKSCLLSSSFARSMTDEGEHSIVSASSSVQFIPSKENAHYQRQLSGKKARLENSGNGLIIKHKRRESPSSEYLDHSCQDFIPRMSTVEGIFDASAGNVEHEAFEETQFFSEQGKYATMDDSKPSFTQTTISKKENQICSESGRTLDFSITELSNCTLSTHSGDTTSIGISTYLGYPISSESVENFPYKTKSVSGRREPFSAPESFSIQKDVMVKSCVDNDHDRMQDPAQGGLVTVFKELETAHENIPGFQIDCVDFLNAKCSLDEFDKHSVISTSEKDDPRALEGCPKHETKNMCVEAETTDTLLVCSSIVHNMAYQAIAMEKEKSIHVDGYWTTVTSFGKTIYDGKDSHVTTISKPSSNSQKEIQRVEIEGKSLSTKKDTDINTNIKSQEPMKYAAMVTNNGGITIPQKVEAKCSCVVM